MSGIPITAADRRARGYTPAELRYRRIPGRRTEQCPVCGELFAGTSVGDAHQYGPWTGRRCRTRAEMAARGMWTDTKDVWHYGAPMDEAAKARRRSLHANLTASQPVRALGLGYGPERPSESILAGSGGGAR